MSGMQAQVCGRRRSGWRNASAERLKPPQPLRGPPVRTLDLSISDLHRQALQRNSERIVIINFSRSDLTVGVAVLCLCLAVLWWRKQNLSYLLFFSIFWFYLLGVVSVVIFPIVINTDYKGVPFKPNINFVPFYFGNCFEAVSLCAKSVIQNIVLTVPFGFGINFLIKTKPKTILWLSLALGALFEFLQLTLSFVFRSGFRATDINDVLLNGTGVLVGYVLFRLFAWLYLNVTDYFNLKLKFIFADVYKIAFQAHITDKQGNI